MKSELKKVIARIVLMPLFMLAIPVFIILFTWESIWRIWEWAFSELGL